MRRRLFYASCVCFLSLAGPASAQSLIDASDPEKVRNIASGYGSATLREDNVGDPMISGRIDGVPYYVFFYGCDEGGESCRSIQFRAAWDMDDFTLSSIRSWNQNKRFGKAYLDQDDDPTIEWDVNLFGGVSVRNLDDSFDWWAIVLKDFEVYIK